MRIKHLQQERTKRNYESYLKNKTAEFKNYIPNLKHTKITLDEPNDAYDYSLTGEIDTQKHQRCISLFLLLSLSSLLSLSLFLLLSFHNKLLTRSRYI